MSRPARAARTVVDPARRAAYDLLAAVDDRDAYANLVLPGLLRERGLGGRDAAFATELGYGTLRWQGTLDAVVDPALSRPVDPSVRRVLRLGAYQLLRMRVPPHAAVSATVDLARAVAGDGPARFANAVLRRVAERDFDGWLTQLAPAYTDDPIGHLALVTGHPRWVVEAFRDALSGSLEETSAALAADDAPAAVHLVARPGRITAAELCASADGEATAGPWSPYAVHLHAGDPGRLPAVRRGAAGVQDEGSQLVALALAAAPLDGADRVWLDLAAGPGGKAALLAGLAHERGARLVAGEVAPSRARLIVRALRGGPPAGVVVADGTAPPYQPGSVDRLLLDAPCTGLGALRRRPEARWRRTPADLARLTRLQQDLLTCAVDLLRPGGLLAYATCSPHPAETVEVVRAVLAARPDLREVDVRPSLPGVPALGDGPHVQLWPHRHGTDAMFLALLRRS